MALAQLPLPVQMAMSGVKLPAQPQPLPSTAALYVPRGGGLATNPAVLAKLEAHALAAGTKLSREEIIAYVALGEHAVDALQNPGKLSRQLGETVVHTGNPPVVLSPNMEAARGISWYVVACAAQQDVNQEATGSAAKVNGQEVTNLTVKGAYVFKDPGNRIYNFLQASPLAYSRVSSHFNERSASEGRMFWKPEQRGIEDYDGRLAGQNGAMLFDKLKGAPGKEEMFLKFEHTGTPVRAQRADDQGKGGASWGQAIRRWVAHAVSYVQTRSAGALGVDRKEHVHKGLLKTPVHKTFMEVVKSAEKLGLSTGASPGAHEKLVEEKGLPHLENTLLKLHATIAALTIDLSQAHRDLLKSLNQAQEAIFNAKAQLGAQSDHLGIERRGAETHIDLHPPRSHLEAAHKELIRPGGALEEPQEVLKPRTLAAQGLHTIPAGVNFTAAKDWNRMGITVNGTHYPGRGHSGNIPSSAGGVPSTLEQACNAFVKACGNHPVAAEWISRIAHQGMAEPVLHYLAKESLGTVGEGVVVNQGVQTFTVDTLPGGAVEVRMDYRYQNSEAKPLARLIPVDDEAGLLYMNAKASLHATVTLRFDDIASYTSTQLPVPVISAPLTYTTSHFDAA